MTAVSLLQTPRLQFLDINGAPLVGGQVFTYVPATTTPATTWSDSAGTIPNANPIVLDALGSASIWGIGSYRFVVLDVNGNLQFDAVSTAPAPSTGVLLVVNNLSDVANVAASRANLGLGTAALANTGTSGHTVPFLDGANTWSASQTLSAKGAILAGASMIISPTPGATDVGFLGVPQGVLGGAYTLVMADSGQEKYFSATATVTIPPNASVAFPLGTCVQLTVDPTFVLTVAQGAAVTLRNPIGNVTGNRTVTGPGSVIIKQQKTNEWWIFLQLNLT